MAAGAAAAGAAAIEEDDERDEGVEGENAFFVPTIAAWRAPVAPRDSADAATRRRKAG